MYSREKELSSDFDSGAEENSQSSGSSDKVDLAFILRVESGVEDLGDVLGDGVGESSGGGFLQLGHGVLLGDLARWVLLVEEVPFLSNPSFFD